MPRGRRTHTPLSVSGKELYFWLDKLENEGRDMPTKREIMAHFGWSPQKTYTVFSWLRKSEAAKKMHLRPLLCEGHGAESRYRLAVHAREYNTYIDRRVDDVRGRLKNTVSLNDLAGHFGNLRISRASVLVQNMARAMGLTPDEAAETLGSMLEFEINLERS